MKTSDGSFHYCFNRQAVVDEKSQVVLAASLRQSGADCSALPDMLTELGESLTAAGIKGTPDTLLADAGYFSADNVEAVTDAGIDPLLATGRLKHGEKPPAGKPIVAGWSYQWVTALDWANDSWTAPMDARRIPPRADATDVTVDQVCELVSRPW